MTEFTLSEIVAISDESTRKRPRYDSRDYFGAILAAKLTAQPKALQSNNGKGSSRTDPSSFKEPSTSDDSSANFDKVEGRRNESLGGYDFDEENFVTVRSLFRNAATALQLELQHRQICTQEDDEKDTTSQASDATSSKENAHSSHPLHNKDEPSDDKLKQNVKALAHWVPGRIEVMGKHTDYAGGNSLVCATAGRGMAMVSTMICSKCKDGAGGRTSITIVSVLPPGMEEKVEQSSCKPTTAAPFRVGGRPVVHHTIHLYNLGNDTTNESDEHGNQAVDWTIYPTAVIHRLHKNFGLYPRASENECSNHDEPTPDNNPPVESVNNSSNINIQIFIAISSNLPPASGLSTSSAFVTGIFLVLDSHLNLRRSNAYRDAIGVHDPDKFGDEDDEEVYNLSTYLGNVENGRDYIKCNKVMPSTKNADQSEEDTIVLEGTVQGGVGTFGGSEDHAAILMGRRGQMRLLSFCGTRPARFWFHRENGGNLLVTNSENMGMKSINTNNAVCQGSIVDLCPDLAFVIAYSGAKAEKAGGADGATEASVGYNCASALARSALEAYLRGDDGDGGEDEKSIDALADAIRWERRRLSKFEISDRINSSRADDPVKKSISKRIMVGSSKTSGIEHQEAGAKHYSTMLVKRFEQFYDESEYLVPAAAYALSVKNYKILGPIVDASHDGAVHVLKNQIDETAWLPMWARGLDKNIDEMRKKIETNQSPRIKALAASAFGAGFGGSCWALVPRSQAKEFARQWGNAYDDAFPPRKSSKDGKKNIINREFFVTEPGIGAFFV